MNEKPFFLSLTFWGAVVAVAAPLSAELGFILPSEGLAAEIVSVLGGIAAIIGRFRAKTTLKLV